MAHDTASVVTLVQPKKVPLSAAERQRLCRERKRQKSDHPKSVADGFKGPKNVGPVTPVTANVRGTGFALAPTMLTGTAFALAAVAIAMNGWYGHSLGSSEMSRWLFCAVGVAADAMALALPACAARLWVTRQRSAAGAAWIIWLATFVFTVSAGLGFASTNISDVTMSRASRVTPAVTAAQNALSDAQATRDRECAGGVGKNCRAREDAVEARRQALDAAMRTVEHTADPQTEAATQLVAWLARGWLTPGGNDFAMLRLLLLAMLPQMGGLLLMIARSSR